MPKFSIGEVAEAYNGFSRTWDDCIIKDYNSNGFKSVLILNSCSETKYLIEVDGCPSKSDVFNGYWPAEECNLRKKKPPKPEMGSLDELEKITEWGGKPGYRPKKNIIKIDPSKPVVPYRIEEGEV